MSDEITPQAEPIPQTGEAAWFPPVEDDNEAAIQQRRPRDLRWVFFGDEGLRAGWSLLLFALIVAALGAAITRLLHHFAPAQPPRPKAGSEIAFKNAAIGEYATFALLAVSALIVSFIEKRRFARYGIDGFTSHRAVQFLVGAVWGASLLALLVLCMKLSGALVFTGVLLHGGDVLKWAAAWFVGFLGVALFEEFGFRGFVQYTVGRGIAGIAQAFGASVRAQRIAGFWLTVLIFSFSFGFVHKSNPGESPVGLISAGTIGLVFALSLWRTGSLWWAIGWHAAWDWAQSFVFGVPDSGTMMQHHLLAQHAVGSLLVSGGSTGPEGSLYVLPIIVLTVAIIVLTLKPEAGSPAARASAAAAERGTAHTGY